MPELFGLELGGDGAGFYLRNVSLFVLPLLTGYFAWKRQVGRSRWGGLAAAFAGAAVVANTLPFDQGSDTAGLLALHLPIALWLVVGVAYAGGRWSLGLLLYSVSARDPRAPAGAFDVLLVALVVSALVANGVALAAVAARITEFGSTPNRLAALGMNVVLLGNLAWSAWLYLRFLSGRGSFAPIERWQTAYLPVYAAWAAIVVLVFPPLFGYQ